MYFRTFGIIFLYFITLILADTIKIYPQASVTYGKAVNITCQIQSSNLVFWSFNGRRIGENTNSYNESLCYMSQRGEAFIVHINKAALMHIGNWSCKDTYKEAMSVHLNVTVPWILKPISAHKVRSVVSGDATTIGSDIKKQSATENGCKKLPFNLLNNESLDVVCESHCGLPAPTHITVRANNQTHKVVLSGGKQSLSPCKDNRLKRRKHRIIVNCAHHGLVGRNTISCESQTAEYALVSNKEIYILCQAKNRSGILTKGELVAIIAALVLAIVDTVIIVLLLRQNFREHNRQKIQYHSQVDKTPSEVML